MDGICQRAVLENLLHAGTAGLLNQCQGFFPGDPPAEQINHRLRFGKIANAQIDFIEHGRCASQRDQRGIVP